MPLFSVLHNYDDGILCKLNEAFSSLLSFIADNPLETGYHPVAPTSARWQ